ncbi:MAG: hypothetical protein JO243_15040 [Solirubrobacterales bacterium]|nr:hypothetical protein [Solirubrobacterales bacterium]
MIASAPKVYLVFWGSQWGSESPNADWYATYSGDPSGVAPRLQAFFKGLGTGGETWSGVVTQYCQDAGTNTDSCPASSLQRVGYPWGGALAGVWEDTSAAAPSSATAHQMAVEAVSAAEHFGNTTTAANSAAVYMIVSPTGTHPEGFPGPFCARHDYTSDPGLNDGPVSTSWGTPIPYINMPYLPDVGTACGANDVNPGAAGALDGVTIEAGHEYAETLTDPFAPPSAELMRRRHLPIAEQGQWLRSVVCGHSAYYAVPDNSQAITAFRNGVTRHWRRALCRRGQRGRVNWTRMRRIADHWLPIPRILHPWPDVRLDARTQGKSPVR